MWSLFLDVLAILTIKDILQNLLTYYQHFKKSVIFSFHVLNSTISLYLLRKNSDKKHKISNIQLKLLNLSKIIENGNF